MVQKDISKRVSSMLINTNKLTHCVTIAIHIMYMATCASNTELVHCFRPLMLHCDALTLIKDAQSSVRTALLSSSNLATSERARQRGSSHSRDKLLILLVRFKCQSAMTLCFIAHPNDSHQCHRRSLLTQRSTELQ